MKKFIRILGIGILASAFFWSVPIYAQAETETAGSSMKEESYLFFISFLFFNYIYLFIMKKEENRKENGKKTNREDGMSTVTEHVQNFLGEK